MTKNKLCGKLKILFIFVTAVFLAGEVFAADITATVTPGIFVPGVPVNLAVVVRDKSADLSWSPPLSDGGSTITDYIIEYKLTSGGVWSPFADVAGNITSTSVTDLTNDNSYDFRVFAKNLIGIGPSSSQISAMPGPRAQVLIQGFSDLTTPSIATEVRITNDENTAYEYNYTWCVTDSDTNLCGGGDDIFDSTAAILIQPHQNFDTTLNSTVPIIGNYYFHLSVQFGSDSSQAFQSFSAIAETPANPPVTPPSGGGGGGGGGGSNTAPAMLNTACVGADFNHDGKVSFIDFSVLLSYWKMTPPFKNPCVDINRDSRIDFIDFSILLYQWGGRPILFK